MPRKDERERLDLRRRAVLRSLGVATAVGAGQGLTAGRAAAAKGGCPGPNEDGSSPPPGPPALYEAPATAPQFENAGPWRADPLRVSGADAYVDGEYLFQDFIYDDHGANTTPAPAPPHPKPDHHDFGPMTGDVAYPTDVDRYAHNAADLLEFRARLTNDGRAHYRITLNTMTSPDVAAIAVGITDTDDEGGSTDLGYGLGDLGIDPQHLLVVREGGAEFDGEPLPDGAVSVNLDRNQIDVELPHSPEGETWRHYLVTGLWDADAGAGEFKQIQEDTSADEPGGAHGQNPPPVFNVGFRYSEQEPMATPNVDPDTIEMQAEEAVEEATGSRGIGYGHWREHAQANALADRDISSFHADVDFGTLADRTTDYRVPETGYLNRIYASHYSLDGVGIGSFETEDGVGSNGEDVILGNLVPYSLYVPEDYDGSPRPLHVHLHSLSGTYNQYMSYTPNFIRQVGKERGAFVLTTTGRGPGVPYRDQAELDVFEAWGDAAHRYAFDADRVTLGGYSMGGIGTHQLASKWPDLFARAFPIVGSIGDEHTGRVAGSDLYTNNELVAINQRHVPLLMWQGTTDELVPFPLVMKYEQHLRDLGLRHELDVFPGYDHLTFAYLDEWEPAAAFLDAGTVERNPPRVTYRAVPATDSDEFDLVHDGAYWVSDIAVAESADHGLVDVRSLAFGAAEPIVAKFEREGTEPKPHVKRGVEWTDPLVNPGPENAVEAEFTDVGAVTLWVEEAAVDPTRPLTLAGSSTTETAVTLRSSVGSETVTVGPGEFETEVDLCSQGQ